MSDDTGGKATSAVPVGTTGTSSVADAASVGATPVGRVVCTTAGDWMTAIVDGVSVSGERSSSAWEKPYATSAAAISTPTVATIRTVRDRRFDSIVSATATTLST